MTPNLDDQFLEPPGWMWGEVARGDRVLRFGLVSPDNPKAIVVCLPGLSEFCEKYFEVARECVAQNYAFAVIDWRGQGRSSRYLRNGLKRHSFGFDQDLEDLHVWVTEHIRRDPRLRGDAFEDRDTDDPLPLIMLAHSMGGNIGMRYLARHPGIFTAAVFSAPMLGIYAVRSMPDLIKRGLSSVLNFVLGTQFTSFHGQHSRQQNQDFDGNPLTSDPARFPLMETWMAHDPALRVGDVTFGWVYHAIRTCFAVRAEAARVQTPCLITVAEHDRIVDNQSAQAVAAQIDDAQITILQGALHEIMMERDDIRAGFFDAFFKFAQIHSNA